MNAAIVTTTIRVPVVLELYHKHAPNTVAYVALDQKLPGSLPAWNNVRWIPPHEQARWRCSELIGWNCIQRRNIATLEALQAGASTIITIDDDNIPMGRGTPINSCVWSFDQLLTYPWSGLHATSLEQWFDPGQLMVPPVRQRGFPWSVKSWDWFVDHAVDVNIGVAQGLILGNADVDAASRLANPQNSMVVSEIGRDGVVVRPQIYTIFNSQFTAFRRELAPAMFMVPHVGRYDDIYASLITQRIMRVLDLWTHFGKPFAYQQRNEHNLLRDLREEMHGMERVANFATWLNRLDLGSAPVLSMVKLIWNKIQSGGWLPTESCNAAFAWLEDCEEAMK
jgi:hypothetical protein